MQSYHLYVGQLESHSLSLSLFILKKHVWHDQKIDVFSQVQEYQSNK